MVLMQGSNRIISAKSPGTLVTFDEVFAEIKLSLFNLKEMAAVTDFYNAEQKKNYRDNMAVLCEFYNRAEYLLLKGEGVRTAPLIETEDTKQPTNVDIQKHPLAQQMARWTEKLLVNMSTFEQIKDTESIPNKVTFIREQYIMLHAGYRVLSGRAVFMGAC